MGEEKKYLESLKSILTKNIELYTNGTLVQYGISEAQALEIVCNLTGLPKEQLIEMKNKREQGLKDLLDKADIVGTVATFVK